MPTPAQNRAALARHRRMVSRIVMSLPEWQARADAERAWRNQGLVYVIQHGAGGLIKIGYSHNLNERIKTLQIVSPLPLRLLGWRHGGHAEEQRIHRLFPDCLAWGEWYRPMPELIEFVNVECEHGPAPKVPRRPSPEADRAFTAARARVWKEYGREPKPVAVSGGD